MLGKSFGNFAVTAKLGQGGMGEVYLAEHRRIGRKVAIKLLLPQHSSDAAIVQRLYDEARASSVVGHPGVVQVFDCDVFEGRAYLVMEYLEGETLRDFMDRVGPLATDPARVAAIGAQIANVLHAAHARGIVHRDLKPDNVFLLAGAPAPLGPQVKVLDFGIAKLRDADAIGRRALTDTGALIGTPLYMSPEQCRGHGALDARSDVYSLGCVLYELLSGRPPFLYDGPGEVISAHLHEPPRPVSELAPVPPELDRLVMAMLAKDPDHRPADMRAVAATLLRRAGAPGNAGGDDGARRRRLLLALALGAMVVLAAIAVVGP